ncbi:MAG: YihY family inner membrane protein [Phycisphaeraceae bacterium]|nr:YihY family inner membrane protein [Phycisphaeraceae bacterium]
MIDLSATGPARRTLSRVWTEAKRSRIAQLAAALAYRTIFAVVPMLVVALVVVRSFVSDVQLKSLLASLLQYMGLTEIVLNSEKLAGPSADHGITGSLQLDEWVAQAVDRARDVPFTAVGFVAALTLFYAAISMLSEVERTFNEVYKAPAARGWTKRITLYWTLLTLGSIGLFASFYIGEQFQQWALDITARGWSWIGVAPPVKALGFITTSAISMLMLLLAYTAVPTARVAFWPAVGGAIIGAILWEATKWGFTRYLEYSTTYARLYGALALVPLFLLWVYLTWAVVLVGLQVSYVMQYGLARDEPTETARVVDPSVGVAIMAGVSRAFAEGKPVAAPQLAQWAGVSLEVSEAIVESLRTRGLVHFVRREEGGPEVVTPARPAEGITVREVLEASFDAVDHPTAAKPVEEASRIAGRLRDAQFAAAGPTTLAELIGIPAGSKKSGARGPHAGWSPDQPGARLDDSEQGAGNGSALGDSDEADGDDAARHPGGRPADGGVLRAGRRGEGPGV